MYRWDCPAARDRTALWSRVTWIVGPAYDYNASYQDISLRSWPGRVRFFWNPIGKDDRRRIPRPWSTLRSGPLHPGMDVSSANDRDNSLPEHKYPGLVIPGLYKV